MIDSRFDIVMLRLSLWKKGHNTVFKHFYSSTMLGLIAYKCDHIYKLNF